MLHNTNQQNEIRNRQSHRIKRKNRFLLPILTPVVLLCVSLLLYIGIQSWSNRVESAAVSVKESPAPENSFTMLLAVSDNAGSPNQMMLLRLDSGKKCFFVMSLPFELTVHTGGGTQSVGDHFQEDGIRSTAAALEQLGIRTDFTCNIPADNMPRLLEIFGGLSYNAPESFSYCLPTDGRTVGIEKGAGFIDGAKALALISYTGYSKGSAGRYAVQSGLLQAFVQQKMSGYYLDHAVSLYKNVFNLVSTNFSLNDLILRLHTLRQTSTGGHTVCTILTPTTQQTLTNGETACAFTAATQRAVRQYFGI